MSSNRTRPSRLMNVRAIGLGIAAFAVFLGVFTVVSASAKTYTAVIANVRMEAGTVLSAGNGAVPNYTIVTRQGEPASNVDVPSSLLTDADLEAYNGLLLTNTVYPGDALRKGDFYNPRAYDPAASEQQTVNRVTELLGTNKRLFAIAGDPTTTFASIGDYVDVYFVPSDPSFLSPDSFSIRLFTKRVVYVVPRLIPNVNDEGAAEYSPPGTTFVLDLTAQQAQDLNYLSKVGTLNVALVPPMVAPPAEVDPGTTVRTDIEYFQKTYGFTLPAEPTATPEPTVAPEPTEEPIATPDPLASPTASPAPTVPALP